MKFKIDNIPEKCIVSYQLLDDLSGIRFSGRLKVFRKPVDKAEKSVYDFPSVEMITENYYIKEDSFLLFDAEENVVGKLAFI